MSEVNLPVTLQDEAGHSGHEAVSLRPLRIAICGFGTVGSSVARILVESKPEGLELTHVFNRGVDRKRVDWTSPSLVWTSDFQEVLRSDADVIVEVVGGLDPAGAWVRGALEAGKSVVTANKKLIAFHGVELERLAAAKGGHLKYGAAVAGGIPVIPGLEQGLAGDRIERIEGILNGTCNFILSKMEDGAEYAAVLAEAQARGYAEADPTEDVGGFDARAKLAILMRLALRVAVNPEEIVPRSITSISAVDFSYAQYLGYTIRQVSRAQKSGGTVAATVGPMLVEQRSPLAWSRGTENMVVVSGQYGGDVVFSGHGAGGHPTAVAVVSDLLALAHRSRRVEIPSVRTTVGAEFEVPHYIRFLVDDRPGIVAEITGSLARERINIRAIVQKPGFPQHALPFVVTAEPCRSSALQRALERIRTMDCLLEPPLDLQMLE
ncbi:MAG TPA: homoserine dehydrogenase [Terracidiphilus sp.]|nr:homoserine dehydrogenase [Terracidiphilus sp.]